jgi:hypothetical protein
MLKQFLTGVSVLSLVMAGSLSAQAQTQKPTSKPQPASQQLTPQQPTSKPSVQSAPTTKVSQEELQKFANAVKQLQAIQRQTETQMIGAIQREGLSEQQFMQIYQSQRNPNAQPAKKATSEEMKKYQQAVSKVTDIQRQTTPKMEKAVKSQGLELQRFNQIFAAIQADPTLKQQVQNLVRTK